ncbi:MAG: MATE family efflux transporter [Coriobacteriales bacterium]|jgi:putative MATE family efflux protein|nr:MATE family efflux transporter [Coriobacteriales bacterium]
MPAHAIAPYVCTGGITIATDEQNSTPQPERAQRPTAAEPAQAAAQGQPAQDAIARVDRLGTAKVTRLMREFAIPSIIGLVVNGLYNIIDSIFLGHGVGPIGLATATIALPIMIVGMGIAILVGQGGNALTALRLGAGKRDEAERIVGVTFSLTIIASLLCTAALFLFMDPVLTLSGANVETRDSAHVFLSIIGGGMFLQFIGMGFNNFIRTAGDPGRALYTMVAGTAVCIVLNWLFVMVLGWGIAGSAWATVIGQGVSAVLVFWYFAFSRKAPFKLRIPNLKLDWRIVRGILALGSAPFVLQIANAVINFVLNGQLESLGAEHVIGSVGALAAIGLVGRVAMFAFFPILGVAMAAQPLFGYNYGAKNYRRVIATFKIAMVWVTAIGIFFWVLVHLVPGPIVMLFGVEDDLLAFTVGALKVQVFMMPLIGLQVVAVQYFQSSGQPLKSMILSTTRQILYLIPLIYLLPKVITHIFPTLTPLDGVYYAYPVADILSIVTCGILMLIEFRKLKARIREST